MSESDSCLHFLNKVLWGGVSVVLCAISLFAAEPAQRIRGEINPYSRFALAGNVRPAIAKAQDQGAVAASATMPLMAMHFSMTPSQNADLLQLLRLQQTRNSTQFHQWLTPEQYADRFGLNSKDIEKVTAWLETMGFSNVQAARSRTFVTFNGTAAQVQTAFNTSIHRYVMQNGESHIANATAPEIPVALNGMVLGIRGLHDFHPHPHIRPHFYSNQSFKDYLVPDDFATIYDIQPLYSAGITGAGRTIAIPGQTDIIVSDIEAFETAAGLPVKDPQQILVPNSPDPGQQITSGDLGESDLDLEWSGAIAKGASIIFVYSTDVFTSVTYAIDNNIADVLPMTYGACESGFGSAEMASLNSTFQQAASQGMTLIAASGDDGAADCDGGSNTTVTEVASQGLAVDFPASSPYVTGMGGTEFTGGSSYFNTTNDAYGGSAISYIPETAWNDTSTTNGLEASGGGASSAYLKPSWQTGTGVPSSNVRYVPDLALDASPNVYGLLFCSDGWCTNGFRNSGGYLDVTGGTSDASPSFGGIAALLDQQTGSRQGLLNQNLYLLASVSSNAFHDITSGNNIVPCSGGSPNCSSTTAGINGTMGYSAGVGYDEVTGLGSVDAYNLFQEWSADFSMGASPTSLTLTPGTSGTATITVSPFKSFSGNVTFTCAVSSSLANTTCSVPGTVTGSGTVTLTVTAGANAAAPWWRTPQFPTGNRGLFYLLTGLLLALSAYAVRQRKFRAVSIAFTLALVVGLSSCGGSSTPVTASIPSGTTSPETGTVTVTGTSGTLSNTTSIAVSVN